MTSTESGDELGPRSSNESENQLEHGASLESKDYPQIMYPWDRSEHGSLLSICFLSCCINVKKILIRQCLGTVVRVIFVSLVFPCKRVVRLSKKQIKYLHYDVTICHNNTNSLRTGS